MRAKFCPRERVGPAHILLASALILSLSVAIAHLNYLFAHALLEGLAIAVALFVYIFASRTRKYTRDDYLLLLGYGSLTVALLDFFHLLTFEEMNIFSGSTANASTQFWVAARYIQAFTLLIAPFAAKRRFRAHIVLPAFLMMAGIVIGSIMLFETFPTCYVEGQGLTPVKVISEYIICVVLVAAIWFTWDYNDEIGASVAWLVILAMCMMIGSELFATLYQHTDALSSLLARAFKSLAMYLIFHGTVAEGLNRPFMQVNRAREQLGERLQFEALLTDLSTELAGQTALPDVKGVIRSSLQRLTSFLNADRGLLLEIQDTDSRVLYAVRCDQPAAPAAFPEPLQFTWLAAELKRGRTVTMTGLPQGLPPQAEGEREYCKSEKIGALACVPCNVGSDNVTAIVLGRYNAGGEWNELTVGRLRLAGEMFSNALARGRAHDEASRLRQELNHVARVSTMGQLTAALAHEIKQPLTAILSNAQVGLRHIRQDPLDREEVSAILSDIAEDDRRASEVINRIRTTLRKGDQPRTPARLSRLANDLLSMLGHALASRHITVHRVFSQAEPLVTVDRIQIQQVMLNLIMNAVEAMGGVAPERRKLELVSTAVAGDGGGAHFLVVDHGPGIAKPQLDTLFDPFVTTKEDGLGMGLAISRGIIEDHGGELRVEATSENGTSMAFLIPLATPDTQPEI